MWGRRNCGGCDGVVIWLSELGLCCFLVSPSCPCLLVPFLLSRHPDLQKDSDRRGREKEQTGVGVLLRQCNTDVFNLSEGKEVGTVL